MNAIGKTGGEKEHKLTIEEMPKHKPDLTLKYGGDGNVYGIVVEPSKGTKNSDQISVVGGDKSHNNMQPYEVVGYMWIRRA